MTETTKYRFKLLIIRVHLLLCLILLSSLLAAQTIPVRHYTLRDGLPSLGIRCIFKDSRGLLWIGTYAGLCTYDGKSFRTFLPSEGMTANQVWSIAEDDEGNMWFGSFGDGLYKNDGRKFRRFTNKDGLADNRIRVLCWSKKFRCLVAGSYDAIHVITGDTITMYPSDENSRNIGTVTGMANAGDFIYITVYGGNNPLRFYPGENKLMNVFNGDVHYPESSFSVFLSSKGDTLFSDYTYGIRIFNKKGIFRNDSIGQIYGISEDKRGDLWLAAWSYPGLVFNSGIFRFDGKIFRNCKNAFGITDFEIWTVYCDNQQDILWIGTLNEGLFMIPFSGIEEYPANYFSPGQKKINSVYLDSRKRLWISGNKDLTLMEPDGHFTSMDKIAMILSFRQYYNLNRTKLYLFNDSLKEAVISLKKEQIQGFIKKADFNFHSVVE